jgi:hypothetical protein
MTPVAPCGRPNRAVLGDVEMLAVLKCRLGEAVEKKSISGKKRA